MRHEKMRHIWMCLIFMKMRHIRRTMRHIPIEMMHILKKMRHILIEVRHLFTKNETHLLWK